jgi:hypothetical protein
MTPVAGGEGSANRRRGAAVVLTSQAVGSFEVGCHPHVPGGGCHVITHGVSYREDVTNNPPLNAGTLLYKSTCLACFNMGQARIANHPMGLVFVANLAMPSIQYLL